MSKFDILSAFGDPELVQVMPLTDALSSLAVGDAGATLALAESTSVILIFVPTNGGDSEGVSVSLGSGNPWPMLPGYHAFAVADPEHRSIAFAQRGTAATTIAVMEA